ncbi:hypothetical protein TEQG_00218 [Trichophyton equinum CBS 127.97]|uniref:Rhodopsin domain-containing protein n=1 Tax=Trichophyton equinum (strain ATCC MYA-4606 / CBS 127.97) TaxID=559882 RepID=F2PGZ9_TRIEC|nr:hypothetical protein TEQG_00218 [Trichophyton equinum CBS 127.97]
MSITPDNLGRGPLIMGLTWSSAVLATIAVGLRFYIRVELNNRPSLDDWLIAIFNFVSQSFVTVGFTYGLGKHDANLQPYQIINILKWMWLANTPGLLVAITARLSIAMLLVRLFGKVHKWLKWFLVVVSGLCTVLTAIIIPCTFLQTTPVSGNWNPFQPSKRWNPMIYISLAFLTQSLWTFTDLTFVLFPVIIIWRLQMSLGKRISLILLMSASLLTMSSSITILWSCLEQAFVIIMGCVPTLGSFTKLKITRPLPTSLDSVLRLINPFKRSTVDRTAKGDGTNSQDYENLEMPKATSDWSDGVYGPALNKSLSSLEGNPQGGYSSTTINDYNYV